MNAQTGTSSPAAGPMTSSAVTRAETHKRTEAGVWLRRARQDALGGLETDFRVPGRPRGVRLAELMEVQRQAGIVHVHRGFGVPYDHIFVLDMIELRMSVPAQPPCRTGRVRVEAATPGRGPVRSLIQDFTLLTDGGTTARGRTQARFVPPEVYARLRRPEHAHEVAPGDPAVQGISAVPLQVDPTDPVLKDHPSDHISAMSLVCALEGLLSQDRSGSPLKAVRVDFRHYIDNDPTPMLEFSSARDGFISGALTQRGTAMATFAVSTHRDKRSSA